MTFHITHFTFSRIVSFFHQQDQDHVLPLPVSFLPAREATLSNLIVERETPRNAEQGDEGEVQRAGNSVGISIRHRYTIPAKDPESKNGRDWCQGTLDQFLL